MDKRQGPSWLVPIPDLSTEVDPRQRTEVDINWANERLLECGRTIAEARSVKSRAKIIDFGRVQEAKRARTQAAKDKLWEEQINRESEYSKGWFKRGLLSNQQKTFVNIDEHHWQYKKDCVTQINGKPQPLYTIELVEFTVGSDGIKKRVNGMEDVISPADVDRLAHDASVYANEIPRALYGYGVETPESK